MDRTVPFSQRILKFTQRHPISTFFAFTFAFSWLLWLLPKMVPAVDPVIYRNLVSLGAFGPALAALSLTVVNAEDRIGLRWDLVLFGWLSVGLLYLLCLPYASTLPGQTGVAGWIARGMLWAAPALLVGFSFSASPALRRLVLPTRENQVNPFWYAAALLFYPLTLSAGYAIDRALGGPVQVTVTGSALDVTLTLAASFIYLTLFGGPLGEEAGWRGFLLPRLQRRFSPLVSALFLALAWILWRFPLQANDLTPGGLLGLSLNPLLTVFLYTWLYNRTRGNLLACLFFHAAATTAALFLPTTTAAIGILTASSLAVIAGGKMWQKMDLPQVE